MEPDKKIKKGEQFSNVIKNEYYEQLRSKLSTFAKMDKYIKFCVHHIHPDILLPSDIIRVILLFYMYDLSKYECIAIFTVGDSSRHLTKGHLSAFNVTERSKYHKSHSLLQHQHRCDLDSKHEDLFRDIYGTSFRVFPLNRFPSIIRDNLFPKYTQTISSDLNLHLLFRIESDINSQAIKTSLIETDEEVYLSKGITSKMLDRCDLIQSSVHGLIALGGRSSKVQMLQYNAKSNEFEWNSKQIRRMNVSRYNHRSVFLENDEKIFVCGGNSGTRTVEMYDFKTNQWKNLKEMHTSRDCHGCVYDGINTKCVYALGAYDPCRNCERYDFVKDNWFHLPLLNEPHRWNPPVKMMDNNHVLFIAGNFYKYNSGWGSCEYLDLRNSANRWQKVDKYIEDALDFSPESHCEHKQMRGLWFLYM